jgi:hypothetical protein
LNADESDTQHLRRLLPARGQRPTDQRAAQQANELAPAHVEHAASLADPLLPE